MAGFEIQFKGKTANELEVRGKTETKDKFVA